jgi:F-type H+-transporting ATPase subunit delta
VSASVTTLARPYARAAFEAARGANALADWARKLEFAAAVAADARVASALGHPRLTAADQVALLLPDGESADSPFAAFVGTLAANRRLALLAEIARQFAELRREHDKVLRVTVRTAVPLEAPQAEAFKAALRKRFQREIELDTAIDPALLGGAVIDAGDVVIDGSVRGRLAQLASTLTH